MIQTYSKFYYGHTVDETNYFLDFQENADPAIVAQIDIGQYTLTDFVDAVARAMNLVGTQEYTVSVNRTTRIITVTAASGTFELLPSTGVNASNSIFGLLGFESDTGSGTSHVGTLASGSEWIPQFKAQDFVDFEDQQKAVDGVTRQSTNGKVESVRFGTTKTMDARFTFITDIIQNNGLITSDSSGVLNARTFLEYATTKADLEFIPNKDDPDTFTECVLESTSSDSSGIGFKLEEMYSKGLVGYYDTGILKFRKL